MFNSTHSLFNSITIEMVTLATLAKTANPVQTPDMNYLLSLPEMFISFLASNHTLKRA